MSVDIVSRTLGVHQEHELLQALENAGLVAKGAQSIISNKSLAGQIVTLAQGAASLPDGHVSVELAARIMGDNFHSSDAVKQYLKPGGRFGRQAAFRTVPFSEQTLEVCAKTHVLQAIASRSLIETHKALADEFWSGQRENPWFGNTKHAFAQARPDYGWYLVRKVEVPGSLSQHWSTQQGMVQPPDFVPSTAVLAQVVLVHYLATGEKLFSRKWVRTNDVIAGGGRVRVLFGSVGLDVDFWVGSANSNVGVAAAQKSDMIFAA